MLGLTYSECRAWADRLPKRARGVIRPRGPGLHRARPPLPLLLYLADREGRLIGSSADAFAVIEPPISRAAAGSRLGRLVGLLPYAPVVGTLLVALPLALVSRVIAVAAVLLALALVVADMVVAVGRIGWALLRPGDLADDEILGGDLRSYQWTIVFCHATGLDDADRLCAEAVARAAALTGPGHVGVRRDSFTDPAVRERLGDLRSLQPVPGTDWFVAGAEQPIRPPDRDAVRPLSVIRLMVAATLLAVAVSALLVASFERIGYPAALAWVGRHVIFRFPEAATWPSRVLGVLVAVLVPVMAACVVLAFSRRIRYRQARRDHMYQALERMADQPTVAIVVVNETESQAVVDAFVARSAGLVPAPGRAGAKAVTLLGALGGASIVLAQSEQGTVGAGSMPWTVDNLIRHHDPVFLVLTGVCYGLDSRELDGGDQEIGDVVVATQLLAAEHRKIATRADGTAYEIGRGPRPESASDLLSHARVVARGRRPRVHFGRVISLNTLVNSAAERARLRALDEEAVAGEMEAAGLYAATAQARRDWIVVKGISDWGVGKTDGRQALAARNAADFVAELIARIEPGAQERH